MNTQRTKRLAQKKDCIIDRNVNEYPASAVLFDGDGNMLHRFDADWTDDQIYAALDFANAAYISGFNVGLYTKALEVRQALEIPNINQAKALA